MAPCPPTPSLLPAQVAAVLLQLHIRRREDPDEAGVLLILGCTDWQRDLLRQELLRMMPELLDAPAGTHLPPPALPPAAESNPCPSHTLGSAPPIRILQLQVPLSRLLDHLWLGSNLSGCILPWPLPITSHTQFACTLDRACHAHHVPLALLYRLLPSILRSAARCQGGRRSH